MKIRNLKCEYLVNPQGIDSKKPRLSWQIESDKRNEKQTACQILVAKCRECLDKDSGKIWDSGKVKSGQSVNFPYDGSPLKSGQKYYWKVRIWNSEGRMSEWSETAEWSMGLLNKSDWKARWIGYEKGVEKAEKEEFRVLPARYFRKEFSAATEIKYASAHICGLGYYELYLNGQKAGDHVLDPVLTQYDKRIPYVTYDITNILKKGKNAVGVVLGNGRYFAPRVTNPTKMISYGSPRLLMQINIELMNGSVQTLVSDGSWKVTDEGPIIENNDYDGEIYDARKEMPGWNTSGFNEKSWAKAQYVHSPKGKLSAQMMEPHRVVQTMKPRSLSSPKKGVWVYDVGQNVVGWCKIGVKGKSGSEVTLRFAESTTPDGMIYTANLRSAKARDIYILKGDKTKETYAPAFTYHGFQFVELTGYPGKPDLNTISIEVVNTDVKPTGSFASSSKLVNQLVQNMKWGIQGNYRSIPTDCPQRDERQGWTGDRVVVSKGETFLFDVIALYSKWFKDIKDAQEKTGNLPHVAPSYWPLYATNVTWPSCYIMGINHMYNQYGDVKNIELHYGAMKKWIMFLLSLFTKEGIIEKDCYGDWCVPPDDLVTIHSKDEKKITNPALLSTAYVYENLKIMSKYARLLGFETDVKFYDNKAHEIKNAFNKKFYDQKLGQYVNGTQTSSLIPLAFGLVPEKARDKVFAKLVDNIENKTASHIGTGLIGCQWLMLGLTDNGRPDLAWKLANNDDYPGWGYMVTKGATTVWELWNGDTADPAMNSRNHVMMIGDFLIWAFERLGGIKSDPENPGFRNIIMKPLMIKGLNSAMCSHESPYGLIVSNWKLEKGIFKWDIQVPPNSSAEIHIPASDASSVKESGKALKSIKEIKFARMEDERAVVKIGSGKYCFEGKI